MQRWRAKGRSLSLFCFTGILFSSFVPCASAACADGEYDAFDKCWKPFFNARVNRAEAQASCEAWGGHLASALSQDEMTFIHSVMGMVWWWFGLSRKSRWDVWEWQDGSVFDYTQIRGFSGRSSFLCAGKINSGHVEYYPVDCSTINHHFICNRFKNETAALAPLSATCDGSFEGFGKCWWAARNVYLTYDTAKKACENWGGQLASVRSSVEANYLQGVLKQNAYGGGEGWVGLRRAGATAENNYTEGRGTPWMWEDGSPYMYFHWWRRAPYLPDIRLCGSVTAVHGPGYYDRECESDMVPHIACNKIVDRPPPRPCDDGQYLRDGKCYWQAQRVDLTWDQSQAACNAWGGELATILDSSEASAARAAGGGEHWIGLRSVSSSQMWTWADGSPVRPEPTNGLSAFNADALAAMTFRHRAPLCATSSGRAFDCSRTMLGSFTCSKVLNATTHDATLFKPERSADYACAGQFVKEGKCVATFRWPMARENAAAACDTWGGELVDPASVAEKNALKDWYHKNTNPWVQLRRESAEAPWQWDDGSAFHGLWSVAESQGGNCVYNTNTYEWEAAECGAVKGAMTCWQDDHAPCVEAEGWCEVTLAGMGVGDAEVVHRGCCGCCFYMLPGDKTLKRVGECASWCSDLNFYKKGIEGLDPAVFDGMTQLRVLTLTANAVQTIAPNTFTDLSGLSRLSLQRNRLQTLPLNTFTGLDGLRELDLSHNNITSMVPGAFSDVTSLRVLFLGGNPLGSVPPGVLKPLVKLEYLGLQAAGLVALEPTSLEGLDNLRSLSLQDNLIADLRWVAFRTNYHMKWVDVQGNPFICQPIFPHNVREVYHDVSMSDLLPCLPLNCQLHAGKFLPSVQGPNSLRSVLIGIEMVMQLARPDTVHALDKLHLELGLYYNSSATQRCWCVHAETCFELFKGADANQRNLDPPAVVSPETLSA